MELGENEIFIDSKLITSSEKVVYLTQNLIGQRIELDNPNMG